MTEYKVIVHSDIHYCQINGVPLADSEGNDLLEFSVNLKKRNTQADILDVIGYKGGVAATLAFTHAGVLLVLNETIEQGYFVEFGLLHNGHNFPTHPEVTIHFVDSN